MSEIESNIKVNIDTSSALSSLKLLQAQISDFHTRMAKSGAAAAQASSNIQQNLINSINASGKFSASMQNIKTTTESFTNALEKNKLSMGQYFRYSIASTKSFGRIFSTEFDTINKVARERVKDLQTQYIKMGRDASGSMKAIAVRPLILDMDNLSTKTAVAAQRQQILNQLLKQGSTNLLNFGKNTQWAGRQLMVGFSIPLSMFAVAAGRAYMQIEKASVQFRRVYGDINTTAAEANKAAAQIQKMAASYTQYGVAVADTMDMAAKAAAMGKTGSDLMAQIDQATKLSVLGGVDQTTALNTTISLTNAFGIASDKLSQKINFLNAVENQTVLNIEDMTTAIPKAAPVVKQLGGNVEDLAYFLTAMKEGGVNASEGANALKSGLASIINPTAKASQFLQGFGINVKQIVTTDKGNLKKTVLDFASALNTLDPLNRAKAIEMMFGKFQFARISTLFKNITDQGSQANKVLGLAAQTPIELAAIANRELAKVQSSPMYKFQKALADIQLRLAPIGESILRIISPILNFASKILDGFNHMSDGFKNFILIGAGVGGLIAPALLMVIGLVANGAANVLKFFTMVKTFLNRTTSASQILGEETNYLTTEQLKAEAVAASLDQIHGKLKQTFTSEADAINLLTSAYERSIVAQGAFATPTMPFRKPGKKYASGGIINGPGTGTSDSILAMVSNGEAIIPAKSVARHPDIVRGLVAGNIPKFADGESQINIAEIFKGLGVKGRSKPNRKTLDAEIHTTTAIQQGHLDDSILKTEDEILKSVSNLGQATIDATKANLEKQKQKLREMGKSEEEIKNYKYTAFSEQTVRQPIGINNKGTGTFRVSEATKFYSQQGGAAFDNLSRHLQDAEIPAKKIQQILNQASTNLQESLGKMDQNANLSLERLNEETKKAIDLAVAQNSKAKAVVEQTRKTYATINKVDDTQRSSRTALNPYSYYGKNIQLAKIAEQILGSKNVPEYISKTRITEQRMSTAGSAYLPITPKKSLELLQAKGGKAEQAANTLIGRIMNMKDAGKELPVILNDIEKQLKKAKLPSMNSIADYVGGWRIASQAVQKSAKIAVERTIEEQAAYEKMNRAEKAADTRRRKQAIAEDATIQAAKEEAKAKRAAARAATKAAKAKEQDAIIAQQTLIADEENLAASRTVAKAPRTGMFGGLSKKTAALGEKVKGSAVMRGAVGGGAMTATMVAGMIPGPIGEFANTISPVVMGLGMLGQFLPEVAAGLIAFAPEIAVASLAIGGLALVVNSVADAEKKRKKDLYDQSHATQISTKALNALAKATGENLKGPFAGYKFAPPQKTDIAKGMSQRDIKEQKQLSIIRSDKNTMKYAINPQAERIGKLRNRKQQRSALMAYFDQEVASGMDEQSATAMVQAIEDVMGKNFNLHQENLSMGTKKGRIGKLQNINTTLNAYRVQLSKPGTVRNTFTNVNSEIAKSQATSQMATLKAQNPKGKFKVVERVVTDESGNKTTSYDVVEITRSQAYNVAKNNSLGAVSGYIGSLSTAFKNGNISLKQYNQRFKELFTSIGKVNGKAGLQTVRNMLVSMDPKFASATNGITDLKDMMVITKAAALGLSDALSKAADMALLQKQIDNAVASGNDKLAESLIKKKNAIVKSLEDEVKANTPSTTPGPGGTQTAAEKAAAAATSAIQKQIDLIKKKADALQKVNDELEKQKQYEDAQQQRAIDMKQAFITGDYVKAAQLKQEMQYEKVKAEKEKQIQRLNDLITRLEDKLNSVQSGKKGSTKGTKALLTSVRKEYNSIIAGMSAYGIPKFAAGGLLSGPGSGTSDSMLARVSSGEYIMKASAVKNIGVSNLDKLNAYASGGVVGSGTSYGDSVYNVNMTINGGNANANDIANMVIKKLETIQIKNNKSNRVGR